MSGYFDQSARSIETRCVVIGIDHDTVCTGVVCAATPGTARDRMSGQFLFYHENGAKHNDKSCDDHDDEPPC